MSQFIFPEFKQADLIGAMMNAQQYRANESKLQQMQKAVAADNAEQERLKLARQLQGRALAGDNRAAMQLGGVDPKAAIDTRSFLQENQQKQLSASDLQRKQSLQKVGAAQNLLRLAIANPALTPRIQSVLVERQLVPPDVWGNEPVTPQKLSLINDDLEFAKTALQEKDGHEEIAKLDALLKASGFKPGTVEYSQQMRKHWDAKYATAGRGVNVYTGDIPLSQKPAEKLQNDIVQSSEFLSRIDSIDRYMPDLDKVLTLMGKAGVKWADIKDKVGALDPESDEAKLLDLHQRFSGDIAGVFNEIRRLITGAAAAEAELARLEAQYPNIDMGPVRFKAAYMQLRDAAQKAHRLKLKILRGGIQDEESKAFKTRLSLEWKHGDGRSENDKRARLNELMTDFSKSGADQQSAQDMAIDQMISEGFLTEAEIKSIHGGDK
jgi:hypothetical protein